MKETADLRNLVERARQGDPAAYETLVDLYANRLYGFLYRLTGSRTDAEDLLQDLFVRVVRMLPRYEHRSTLEGWLFRIATNLARDHIRRARRTPPMLSIHAEPEDDGGQVRTWRQPADTSAEAPGHRMERSEDADALQQALAGLPAPEREVVMLRHFSDMSFAEIADVMGTPLGTALARAHRGLNKLRRMLAGDAES
jgi:RNA polymerase sigma-70 factor (ECF subfamily)